MRFLRFLALTILFSLLWIGAGFAQSTVTVPVGDWLYAALPAVSFVLLVVVLVVLALLLPKLPPWAQAALKLAITKENIAYAAQAINAAVYAVAGAAKGKELTLNVGSPVVAKAAQSFVDTAPKYVVDRLGGLEGVKRFIISQLEDHGVVLPDDVTADMLLAMPQLKAVTGPN